jgi:hypothetical protein
MINEYNINININTYIMLFRNIDGKIIEIKKYNFVNDYIYYTISKVFMHKIMFIYLKLSG